MYLNSPEGVLFTSPDGRVLAANPAACEILGRSEAEICALGRSGLTDHSDPRWSRLLSERARTGRAAGIARMLRADGTPVEVEMSARVFSDPDGGTRTCTMIRDVTERVRLQAELADWKARTQSMLDNSPMAMFMRDLDGRWVTVNRRLQEILGRTEEELRGQTTEGTHTEDERTRYSADDLEVLTQRQAKEFDVTFRDASKGGEERHFWLQKFPVVGADGRTVGLGGISLDVTDRERTQRDLHAARQRFEVAFEHAPVGKVISRLSPGKTASEVVSCNPAFAEMLGYTPEELVGRPGADLTHPDDLENRDGLINAARAGQRTSGEVRMRHRDGHYVWTLVAPALFETPAGETEMIIQAVDITQRKHLEQQLRELADHDALTGLTNRRVLSEEITRGCARARRYGLRDSLLLLDLDGFKYVNDTFGHAAGDELIVRVGHAISETLREVDIVGRIGGDEFAVVLADTGLDGARATAAKLIETVRSHGVVVRDGKRAQVTASIGVTIIDPRGGRDAEDLLVEADIAMYQAKNAGKDQVAVYERPGRRPEDRS